MSSERFLFRVQGLDTMQIGSRRVGSQQAVIASPESGASGLLTLCVILDRETLNA